MFYEGFSDNMRHELTSSEIVLAKIEELADTQLEHEVFVDEVTKERRRQELVTQLHDVVCEMTDKMIARLNSNPFIRVPLFMNLL
jgi:hypothetical protein